MAGAAGGRARQLAQEGLGIEAQARQARYQDLPAPCCPVKCWLQRNISTIM